MNGFKMSMHGLKMPVHGLRMPVHGFRMPAHGFRMPVHGLSQEPFVLGPRIGTRNSYSGAPLAISLGPGAQRLVKALGLWPCLTPGFRPWP